jgi:hypothetical protein
MAFIGLAVKKGTKAELPQQLIKAFLTHDRRNFSSFSKSSKGLDADLEH